MKPGDSTPGGINGSKVIKASKPPKTTAPPSSEELIPRKGNYKALISYQKAEAIYDITYYFCSHYLKRGDRTVDQMVQAARSGKQTIANMAIILIKQTDYLLYRQLKALEEEFLENGGMRERMTRMRIERRYREKSGTRSIEQTGDGGRT